MAKRNGNTKRSYDISISLIRPPLNRHFEKTHFINSNSPVYL